MPFSYDQSWDNFETVLQAQLPIREAWSRIIDFHEQQSPKPYWEAMRQLPLEEEQADLKTWMEQMLAEAPLPEEVVALWIGIFKNYDQKEETEEYVLYLTGSKRFDAEDTEWAAEPSYLPDNRYGVPDVLNELHALYQKDEKDGSFLDWMLPLAYCSLQFDAISRSRLKKELFLVHTPTLQLATGHDSGDYKLLTPIA